MSGTPRGRATGILVSSAFIWSFSIVAGPCLFPAMQQASGFDGGSGGSSHSTVPYLPGEVIVKLRDGSSSVRPMSEQAQQSLLAGLRSRHGLGRILDGAGKAQGRVYRVQTERDVKTVCTELGSDPEVEYAQPNYRYHPFAVPNDPLFADQYAHQLAQMPEAWDITTGSPKVIVAVIGTGVDVNHPDLKDNIWTQTAEVRGNRKDDDGNGYVDDVQGWDFGGSDADVYPTGSDYYADHETMVSGIIAARGNNGVGSCGVTWSCKIMPLRVSDDFTSAEVAGALRYAADNGAQVVNMSFGADVFGPEGDPLVKEAIDYASGKGVLLVAAAGNDDTDRPNYPAAYYNVLAVAATDGEDMRARWQDGAAGSSFGLWVDLAAPGTEMATCSLDGTYSAVDGTSFSSPYVAGVAALLLSQRPDLSAMLVRAILENTSDPTDYSSMDPNLGYLGTGRVNGYRALQGIDTRYPLGEIVEPGPRQEFSTDANQIPIVVFVSGEAYRLEFKGYGQDAWTLVQQTPAGSQDAADGLVHLSMPNPGVGSYVLRLTVTVSGRSHVDQGTFGVPPGTVRRGWPASLSGDELTYFLFYSSPLCLDVDGDGRPEVIQPAIWESVTDYGNRTYVWNQDGSSVGQWPQTLDGYSSPLTSVVGDIDGDADLEVVTVTNGGAVYAWHAEDGRPVSGNWPRLLGYWDTQVLSSPVLADLDRDGKSEVLVAILGTFNSLNAIRGDGSLMWERIHEVHGPISVADMDHDGQLEIALCGYGAATSNIYTYVLDHQGQQIKRWKGGSDMGTVIADLDGDDKAEVVFCAEDSVKAVRLDGSTLWTTKAPGEFSGSGAISVADLDGDGRKEVFVSTLVDSDSFEYTLVYAFDAKGRPLSQAGFPKKVVGSALESEPLVGDLDGDGGKELLVGAAGASLMAWRPDGGMVAGFPRFGVAASDFVTPTLADQDGDGLVEILLGGEDYQFHVIDLPGLYNADTMDWAMFRHDPQGSGWASRPARLNPASIPKEVRPGQRIEAKLTAINPDGLSVRFYAGGLPEGAWFDGQTGILVWKPTADQVLNTYVLRMMVTDGVRQDVAAVSVTVVPDAIYYASMDTDPGWTLDEGWAWGRPAGKGSWKGDPNSGHTGTGVLGYNLNGDYSNSLGQTRYATTGDIDCTAYGDIRLGFWRWLGVESPYDKACVQVSNDGVHWTDLWTTGHARVSDSSWQFVEYPVPADVVDGQPKVLFRWGIGPTDDSVTYPGWNIDDVLVVGEKSQ